VWIANRDEVEEGWSLIGYPRSSEASSLISIATIDSRLMRAQRLLSVESQVVALLEICARQPKRHVVGAKRILDCVVTLVDPPRPPKIGSSSERHHQTLVSIQSKMRGLVSGTGANRPAVQRILRRSITAFHNLGQGFLAAAKPEGQPNLVH